MIRVLIIDDHEIVRRGIRDLLAVHFPDAGFEEACHASEAIEHLVRDRWNAVILDINLPGRSGFEVLGEARRLHPRLPVLVLTSYAEELFAVRAFKLGASAYLSKGEASDQLVVALHHVLAGGKYLTPRLAERLASSLEITAAGATHEVLSQRELQVLRFVALGKSLKEIAAQLGVSEKTVSTYRRRIAEKTGLSSAIEITRYALKAGLVD